jgi:hypothetical protein
MAIADRATATSDGTGTSLTYAHSVAGTTNLVIWCAVDSWRNTNFADPTSVTYAGGALTKLANFLGGGGNDNACSVWRRIAPATGSNNIVVTHAQSHDITAMSYSSSGVDQTTPNDTVQSLDSTDADPTHSVTSETGDLVVSFIMGWGWVGLGEDGDLTIQLENNNTSGINSIAVGDAPGAASVNASWTTTSFNDPFGLFSFNVNAAVEGGAEERDLTGSQPAATGALARLLAALRGLAGSQPAGTAALTRLKAAPRSLAGSQPAATGALARSHGRPRSLAGSQPTATGTLAGQLSLNRDLAGDQPSSTGALTRLKAALRSPAGAQPAATGALARAKAALRSLTGTQPAATGTLARAKAALRSLAGDWPTATGDLARSKANARSLTGAQPAATGTLAGQQTVSRGVAGSLPAPTGALAHTLSRARALAGNWPTATGALGRLLALLRSLSGEQPAATGALARRADTSQPLAGALPAPEGNLTRHAETAVALAGSQPAATGALTYFQGETDVPGHLTLGESLVAEALLGNALVDTVAAGAAQ